MTQFPAAVRAVAAKPATQSQSQLRPAALVDRAYLARFTLGNLALEREVLALFAGQAPLYVQRLSEAQSMSAWREAAHTLKGSAAAVGIRQVASLAEAAERLQIFGPDAQLDATRAEVVAALAEAVAAVCIYIQELQD